MKLLTVWGHRKEQYHNLPPELLEAVSTRGEDDPEASGFINRKLDEYRRYDDFNSVQLITIQLGDDAEEAVMDVLYPDSAYQMTGVIQK